MSKELIERARKAQTSLGYSLHFGLCAELADRIEELEAERNKFKLMFDAINADFDKLEDERDELKAAIELYEQALMASWPEGAMGDAFDYWNAARAAIAKGEVRKP